MTTEISERQIGMEHLGSLSTRVYKAAVARIDLPERTRARDLHLSSRAQPCVLSGADISYNGGRPDEDDLPDAMAWILTAEEFQGFANRAAEADDEWGWFPDAVLSRQLSGDGGNLCLAVGTEPGVMSGFLVLKRGLVVEARNEMSYHFEFDRAYLIPEARGARLSTAFVALASLVFRHEFDALASAVAPTRGKTTLNPFLAGEAESPGGARMLNALVDEIQDVCEAIDMDHDRVAVEELVADVESYDPDDAPRP